MSDAVFNPTTLREMVEQNEVIVTAGSKNDYDIGKGMIECCKMLDRLGVKYCKLVTSAHRTPERVEMLCKAIEGNGLVKACVVVAGAGGAAHLAGKAKSYLNYTTVLGVPIESSILKGIDSLYSTIQMPEGVPVPTLAIGKAGGINAAISAAEIVARTSEQVRNNLIQYRKELKESVVDFPE